jgi:hypothetical protein
MALVLLDRLLACIGTRNLQLIRATRVIEFRSSARTIDLVDSLPIRGLPLADALQRP